MRTFPLFLLAALLGFSTPPAHATSVAAWPWQYQVAHAGFIGVVRCETAGLIAARYRVIDSWKGPPRGALLTIDQTLDYWGPYTPFVLVGEEYLICAFPRTPESSLRWCSSSFGCGQPYWWRESGAELYTSLATPPLRLPVKDQRAMGRFGIWPPSWRAYRESVLTFTAKPPRVQEGLALRRWASTDLRIATRDSSRTEFQKSSALLLARIDSVEVDSLVSGLIALARDHQEHGRSTVEQILARMGGERALAGLRTPVGRGAFPGDTNRYLHPIRRIASRLAPEPVVAPARVPRMTILSDSARRVHRAALMEKGQGYLKSFAWLTEHDPATVAEFLHQETVPAPRSWTHPKAYELASYFGWRCGDERARNFERLLAAREPVVRVAGAVYWTYEDSLRGSQALRRLLSLQGFAGAWAAIVLASMGDREAMPRALEVFEIPVPDHERHHHAALMARLLVLLSNSASSSGVEQPPASWGLFLKSDRKHGKAVRSLKKWWSRVDDKIRLFDPWRSAWAAQKVD